MPPDHPANGQGRPQAPVRIDPFGVYTLDTATELIAKPLGLGETTLRREARLGRLRVSRRGGVYLTSGRALLRWVEGRGARRRKAAAH